MKRFRTTLAAAPLALAAAVLSSGCAVVQSSHERTADVRRGMVYMLPKALLPVELVEADGVLMVRVKPAQLIGDPTQRYLVSHGANAFSSDDVKIEVDPATGLLSKITATAEDQSLAALGELVKAGAVRKAESGTAGSEVVLFSGLLDPDAGYGPDQPNGRLTAGLEQALLARLQARASACEGSTDDACKEAARLQGPLLAAARAGQALVVVRATPLKDDAGSGRPAAPAATQAEAPSAPCDQGVCHRALQPFVVELAIRGVQQQSTLVLLPNGGAPIALPLDRAPFVKTEYTVEFDRGQLQSVHTVKPSSALALVKWPLDIYQSVLEATATLIQLRIGANTKEVELAQSQLDMAKELKRIREEMEKLNAEGGTAQPASLVGGPRRGDALLAVDVGMRPTVSLLPKPTQQPDKLPPAAGTGKAGEPKQ